MGLLGYYTERLHPDFDHLTTTSPEDSRSRRRSEVSSVGSRQTSR